MQSSQPSNIEKVYSVIREITHSETYAQTGELARLAGLTIDVVEDALRLLLEQGRIIVDDPLVSTGRDGGEIISYSNIRLR